MFVRSNMMKWILFALVFFIIYETVVFLLSRTNATEEALHSENDLMASVIPKIPIKVSVYYEALCPDSRNFILHQLVPTYERGPRIVDYELVPYGKAKTEELVPPGNHYKFQCQHGSVECYANKIHSCAARYVSKKTTLLKFVACMINDNMEPEQVAMDCAREHAIDVSPILLCAQGPEGEILLKNYGEMTAALRPKVSFIPTILINGNQYNQARILKNLWSSVCDLFPQNVQPEECHS
uniref:Gamma-interferon-inducible lysosomal thiol reductase n=1 Tax=Cacopsylla melanoneura TaxID=428564 RepID=A0A8D8WZG4_9HEMI